MAAGLRTQKALAEQLGIPQPQLSDWENDRYAVLEIQNLIMLAKVFHCSVDALLAGVDRDYDRIAERGAGRAPTVVSWPDIAVVAEGDALPDGITRRMNAETERRGRLGMASPALPALGIPTPTGFGFAATRCFRRTGRT